MLIEENTDRIKALEIKEKFHVDQFRRAGEAGQALWFREMDVSVSDHAGKRILFATDKMRDPIQRANRHGYFYEEEELTFLRDHVPGNACFVDIGANVGNHTLYAAICLGARRVIPFEPNPLAYRLLLANVLLNRLEGIVQLDHIGMGLADRDDGGFGMTEREKNLGAARMVAGAGDIPVATGDSMLADETPDFIKIDVEGMEMLALRGLDKTIARARPKMLIEVDQENYDAFDAWCSEVGYTKVETIQRYPTNRNFVIEPAAGAA